MSEAQVEIRHIPALDGLRGLAVLGILLFHTGDLAGGWLGVDLFFVLSGFLITSLLLQEMRSTGRIDLLRFWVRRARRLLPALMLALVGIAGYALWMAEPEELSRIRIDALATLFYMANWNAIYGGHDYWQIFQAPSPLDHTWSLAIEEQFYLLWPPLAFWVLRRSRNPGRAVGLIAAFIAIASAAWMAMLFDEAEGTARVYFGTDTRAAAPLVGAALAAALQSTLRASPAPRRLSADVMSLLGMVVLAAAWLRLDGSDPFVYRGGLFLLSLAAAAVTGGVILSPSGLASRLLSLAPLRLLGLISYGLYLWHWPVYLVLTPERVGLDGWPLSLARIAASLAVAVLSYRFVERPIRSGAHSRVWEGRLALVGFALTAAVLVIATSQVMPAPSPVRVASETGSAGVARSSDRVDLFLVGDSVATKLAPRLGEMAGKRGLKMVSLASAACTLLQSDRLRYAGGPNLDISDCRDTKRGWNQWISTHRPRMVLILEGWSGMGDRLIGDQWLHPCQADFDRAYARDLRAAVKFMSAQGSLPLIATNSPPSEEDIRRKGTPVWDGLKGDVLFTEMRKRMDCQNEVRRAVVAATPAQLLPFDQFTCPEGKCRSRIGNSVLRSDGVHFSGSGESFAADWILNRLAPENAIRSLRSGGSTPP